MRHYVTFDQGAQTLYHVPADLHVRPARLASATYEIVNLTDHEDSPDRVVQASGAATVDSTSVVTTAASGSDQVNPRRISLDSTTGLLVGHDYLLEGTDGITELVRVDTIDTDNGCVLTRRDIRGSFTDSSELRGIELQATFPLLEANDETEMEDGGGPYGLIWTYTIDGRDYYPIDDIYVRRHSVQPMCTVPDVLQAYPPLAARARGEIEVEDAIAIASKHARVEIENADQKPELLSSETLTLAVIYLSVANSLRWLRSNGGEADIDDIEHFEGQYRHLIRSMLNGQPPSRTTSVTHVDAEATAGGHRRSFNELIRPS